MRLGIDFGTSYSAAGVVTDGRVTLLKFGNDAQFRTAVYFPPAAVRVDSFVLTPELERKVDSLVRAGRRAGQAGMVQRPAEELRRDAIQAVRRDWLEQQVLESDIPPSDLESAVFGEEAIDVYLAESAGRLVQSPKSMLAYDLHPRAKALITAIVARILEHIRLTAVSQLNCNVRSAVIGRPVNFRGSVGEKQALEILSSAAQSAGFDDIEFLSEPAAAAMGFHSSADEVRTSIVCDVGGGTTDIAAARLGGQDRAPRIMQTWGIPKGGFDVDLSLSLAKFMPLFGLGRFGATANYVDAAMVNDVQSQHAFQRWDVGRAPQPYRSRLRALQMPGNTVRLNRAVERIEIFLSDHAHGSIALRYIDRGLLVEGTSDDVRSAAEPFLERTKALLTTVCAELKVPPDLVVMTGGMSRAPYVRSLIRDAFPSSELVTKDASLDVVNGLAIAAAE